MEVGSSTGMVTRRLLAAGADVVAVEPDPGLAAHLGDVLPHPDLTIVTSSFEEVGLPAAAAGSGQLLLVVPAVAPLPLAARYPMLALADRVGGAAAGPAGP